MDYQLCIWFRVVLPLRRATIFIAIAEFAIFQLHNRLKKDSGDHGIKGHTEAEGDFGRQEPRQLGSHSLCESQLSLFQ